MSSVGRHRSKTPSSGRSRSSKPTTNSKGSSSVRNAVSGSAPSKKRTHGQESPHGQKRTTTRVQRMISPCLTAIVATILLQAPAPRKEAGRAMQEFIKSKAALRPAAFRRKGSDDRRADLFYAAGDPARPAAFPEGRPARPSTLRKRDEWLSSRSSTGP